MALAEERRAVAVRLGVMQYLIALVFSVLAVNFWVLQVAQHETYAELAENNNQRTLALRAPRGVVFDRNGTVLVENRHSYSISILREHTEDLNRTVQLLASLLGFEERGVGDIVERHRREPAYRPIVIVQDATLPQVATVTARRLELPDVVIEQIPTRQYHDTMAAHLLGYVGEVNDAQIAGTDTLKSGDVVGQAGIEKAYNNLLMGEDGAKIVMVNNVGREIRTLEEQPATEGRRLRLTLDVDVQRAVEDGFKAIGYNGAAVILDPNNGDVLAFTSIPAYNPNAFAGGIDRSTWAALNTDEDRPLNDRAIQGRYSPGSTFKMAVAIAALEEGVITPDFRVQCTGGATFYGKRFRCWKKGGHGTMDLRHAIEQSCNVYFYAIGNMTGIDKIHKWATRLGLGEKSGIDLPNEVQGLVPSTQWKQEKLKEKWYSGETISVAIGQGQVSVTPVSMAVYMAALANGGTRVTPRLLKAVDDGTGWKDVPPPPPQSKAEIHSDNLKAIRDGLWMAVNQNGTGGNARVIGYDVAGKTGTVQVISLEGAKAAKGKTTRNLSDHGWFVFLAPRENPQIAGVIFAEHSEHGSTAALVARHALETFFAKRDGKPLPPPPVKQVMPPAPAEGDDPPLVLPGRVADNAPVVGQSRP